jgi:hypothetical protein
MRTKNNKKKKKKLKQRPAPRKKKKKKKDKRKKRVKMNDVADMLGMGARPRAAPATTAPPPVPPPRRPEGVARELYALTGGDLPPLAPGVDVAALLKDRRRLARRTRGWAKVLIRNPARDENYRRSLTAAGLRGALSFWGGYVFCFLRFLRR